VLQLRIEGHVFQILGLQSSLQELRRGEQKLRDDFQIQSRHAIALLLDLQLEDKSQERIQAM
jgi:Tfp pilus assembly protein PilO